MIALIEINSSSIKGLEFAFAMRNVFNRSAHYLILNPCHYSTSPGYHTGFDVILCQGRTGMGNSRTVYASFLVTSVQPITPSVDGTGEIAGQLGSGDDFSIGFNDCWYDDPTNATDIWIKEGSVLLNSYREDINGAFYGFPETVVNNVVITRIEEDASGLHTPVLTVTSNSFASNGKNGFGLCLSLICSDAKPAPVATGYVMTPAFKNHTHTQMS